jgi:hypothetical protein
MMMLQWAAFLTEDERHGVISSRGNLKDLHDNIHIVNAFIEELIIEKQYYNRSSARYIVEKLRHRSNLKDNSVTFKISNDLTPKINSFVLDVFPELKGFLRSRSAA